ncbi:MAG: hypothetical protein ACT4PZ_19535 [Panacagrimonas sp.]
MIRTALLFVALFGCTAAAAAPTPAWVAKGFKQPESALYVAAEKAIFVSNLNGAPDGKDGNGFISRLDDAGKPVKLEWLTGLNAPKGLAYALGTLYVADIDELVAIDVKSATVLKRYPAPGAKMLNDVALEPRSNFKGQVARAYVSDFADNAIWYLGDNKFSKLLQDAALETPNGLLVEGENLIIANWGVMGSEGYKTEVPGRLKAMKLDEEGIADRFSGIPLGNLDGLESDGKKGYWVSDWLAGKIIHVAADGTSTVWLQLEQGTADIGIIPGKALLVPMMLKDELRAYSLPK